MNTRCERLSTFSVYCVASTRASSQISSQKVRKVWRQGNQQVPPVPTRREEVHFLSSRKGGHHGHQQDDLGEHPKHCEQLLGRERGGRPLSCSTAGPVVLLARTTALHRRCVADLPWQMHGRDWITMLPAKEGLFVWQTAMERKHINYRRDYIYESRMWSVFSAGLALNTECFAPEVCEAERKGPRNDWRGVDDWRHRAAGFGIKANGFSEVPSLSVSSLSIAATRTCREAVVGQNVLNIG